MIKIGLTGGIGSGKSTIAQAFETLGVQVYSADANAKMLMQTDERVKAELMEVVGSDVFDKQGLLDRKLMAARIFSNQGLLRKVNGITHKAVFEHFARWAMERETQGEKYVIFEAAVLIESGHASDFDQVWLATAPKEMRIARTMLRDNCSREKVVERIKNQLSDTERQKFASRIFVTDDHTPILQQIIDTDKQLRC